MGAKVLGAGAYLFSVVEAARLEKLIFGAPSSFLSSYSLGAKSPPAAIDGEVDAPNNPAVAGFIFPLTLAAEDSGF